MKRMLPSRLIRTLNGLAQAFLLNPHNHKKPPLAERLLYGALILPLLLFSFDSYSQVSCAAGETKYVIEVTTGGSGTFPSENGWALLDNSGTVIDTAAPGTYSTNAVTTDTVCLVDGAAYTFRAYDSYGDGWNGNTYSIYRACDNSVVADNGGATPDNGVNQFGSLDLESTEAFNALSTACPSCLPPSALAAGNITTSSADLSWTENGSATLWDIEYGPAGYTQGGGTTVAGVSSNPYTLSGLSPQTSYDFYVRADCGASGQSPWVGPLNFSTLCLPASVPYIEDFSSGSFPICWSRTDPVDVSIEASCGSRTNVLEFNQTEEAITGDIDASAEPSLQVSYYFGAGACTNDPEDNENFHIDYWDGTQWVQAKNYDGTWPMSFVWDSFIVPQSAMSSSFKLRFNMISGTTDAWQIDSLVVETGPACAPPVQLGAYNISSTSADLYWTTGGASDWNVEYGAAGFSLGSGMAMNATNDTISVTGLTPNTSYEFYVRDSCGVGSVSSWAGPFSFTTACAAFMPPFLESFDGSSTPSCWSESGSESWNYSTSAGYAAGSAGDHTGNSGNYAWIDGSSPSGPSQISTLTSPLVDVSGLTVPQLRFYVFSHNTNGTGYNTLDVEFYDGAAWNTVYTNQSDLGASWFEVTVDLSTYTITGNVQLRFTITENSTGTSFYNDILIDDVEIRETPNCPAPSALGATNITSSSADLYWTTGGASSWYVEYGPSGFTQGGGTTMTSSNDTLSISGLMSATSYDFYVRDICGPGDSSLWVGPYNFTSLFSPPQPLNCTSGNPSAIFTEEFESVGGWTGDINGGNDTWEIPGAPTSSNTGPNNEHSGAAGSFMNFEASNTSVSSGAIVSPAIDLTAGLSDAELSFWMHAYGADMGTLTVGVGTSASGPFTPVFTWSGPYQTSGADPWVNVGVDLSSYLGQTIYLEFHQLDDQGGFEGDMSIDLVEVLTCITCPIPSSLTEANITSSAVDLGWTENGTATEWEISYGPTGFTPGTGSQVITTSNPYSLSGLTPATGYDWYVRAICAAGDTSAWSGVSSFTTLCATFATPHIESFDNTSLPNCWTTYSTSGETWTFGTNTYAPSSDHTGNGGEYATVDDSESPSSSDVTLESPPFDVSTLTNPELRFFLASADATVTFTVDVWDGSTWNTGVFTHAAATTATWDEIIVNLTPYASSGTVAVRFVVDENNGSFQNDVAIDDVEVRSGPTCPAPSGLSSTTTSPTSADVSWTSGGASNWNVEYGLAGFTPGSGTMVNATATTLNITGLSSNVPYEFYVRDSCAPGDVSPWVGPFTFGALVACDDFDQYSTGAVASQSLLINGWAGSPGDAEVSTDYANSGSNSLKIHDSGSSGFSDVVAEVGTYNSGAWKVAVDLYVPSGNGGYYNILHNYTGASNTWAIEVTLDANGTATVDEGTNGTGTVGTYSYNVGAWNTVEHIIDLNNDTAFIVVNGTPTSVGWQFSLGSTNFGDQFNAMNFYSTAPTGQTPLIYFDNFCITPYTVGCGSFTAPFTEDFETSSPSVACWTNEYVTDTLDWTLGTGSSGGAITTAHGGSQNAVFVSQNGGPDITRYVSPEIDISGLPSPELRFWYGQEVWFGDQNYLNVYYRTSPGGSWNLIWSDSTNQPAWTEGVVSLPNPSSTYQVAFEGINNWGRANVLDDVSIMDAPTCPAPTMPGVVSVTDVSADIYWTTGGASDWNVEYGPAGFTPGTGTLISPTNDTTTISGLMAGTSYEFYVRDSCGMGDVSAWVGPTSFSTLPCAPASQCTHSLVLSDAFGDGWNGTEVTVYQGGAPVGVIGPQFDGSAGSPAGDTLVSSIDLCDALPAYFVITAGSNGAPNYSNEIGLEVTDPFGIQAAFYDDNAAADQGDTIMTFTASCAAPACLPPSGLGAYNITTTSADLYWTGAAGANSYNIEYGPAGFGQGMGTSTSSVNDTFSLSGIMPSQCYDYYVQTDCGSDSSVWVGPYTFCTLCGPFIAPYTQTFDTNAVPGCWSSYEASGSGWEFGQLGDAGYAAGAASEQTGNGGYYAWIDFSGTDDSTNLEMFDVDVSALTTPALQFSLFSYNTNSSDYNILYIEAYDGTNWVQVDSLNGDLGGWALFNIDISSYVYGSNLVRIRFRGESGGGGSDFHNDLLIDDVSILELPLCVDPTGFAAPASTTSSVDLVWVSDTNVVSSVVQYGAPGFTLGSGTTTATSTPGSITIGGLMAATCYDFYVLDSCGAGTNWVGPLAVCTKSACTVTGTPTNVTGDSTGCGGGIITLNGMASGGQRILWKEGGQIRGTGSPFSPDSIFFTTNFEASNFNTAGSAVHVGPLPSIATTGFGNFTNGQYITVMDTLVIDSMTVRSDGLVNAQMIITDKSVSDGGIISQRGEVFSTPAGVTTNTQVPVGVVLTPGNYFISIDFLPGSVGSLFRATGGAVYPYVEPGLISIDSVNFTGPRYYYTFDLVVQQACIGTGTATAVGYVPGANAGTSDSATVCASNSAVDLTAFLGTYDFGGTWYDDDGTGALTDSIFDASSVTVGTTYNFTYGLPATGGCASDSATLSVTVEELPFAGNDTTNTICKVGTTVQLNTYVPGSTSGGNWVDLDGAGAALIGSLLAADQLPSAGTYSFRYEVAGTVCPGDSAVVTLNVEDTVNAGMNASDTLCDTLNPVDLTTYLGANYTMGGTWIDVDGSGGLSGAVFDPAAVSAGQTYNLRYLVTSACGDDSANVAIYVEDCPIGLREYVTGTLDVYPNPTSGLVNIEAKKKGGKIISVEVYSINGQRLISRSIDGQLAEIDLGSFANGLYNVIVVTDEGTEVHRINKD